MTGPKRIPPEQLAKLHQFPELEAYLPGLVQRISADLPPGLGFALFVFDFGQGGRIAYASSAERADMVRTVKEWIAHEAGGAEGVSLSFRVDASRYGPQKRVRTFVGHVPKLGPPKPGPRLLREILRPGPWILPSGTQDCERRGRQWYSSGVVRVFKSDKPCPTVTAFGATKNRGCMIDVGDGRIRQITLQEAALVQGFPEDFVFVAAAGRAWKMVGQAIPIQVGRAILEAVVAAARKKGALS